MLFWEGLRPRHNGGAFGGQSHGLPKLKSFAFEGTCKPLFARLFRMQRQEAAGYRRILNTARRFARSEDEARDLAQEVLLIALAKGIRNWSARENQPWLAGVARKQAAFAARTASRRRSREQAISDYSEHVQAWRWQPAFLRSLPPSLRVVAKLASADLTGIEIRWLLQLSPMALRSRLSALRRAVRSRDELPTADAELTGLTLGKRRATVLATLKRAPDQFLATHDVDGHAILFRILPHKSGRVGNDVRKDLSHAHK